MNKERIIRRSLIALYGAIIATLALVVTLLRNLIKEAK